MFHVQPIAGGGDLKDCHLPAVLPHLTPEPRAGVRVFSPDPAKYLFSIPEWEAKDRVRRNEAREMSTGKKRRGIQLLPKTKTKEHTLAAQLSEWQEVIAEEHPELWVTNEGLATLEQVEGLPVVGQAIKLFYGPRQVNNGQ